MLRILSLILVTLIPLSAFAMPARILIIRHGEKPATGNELNAQGLERAQKLAPFFQKNSLVNQFGAIAGIYAMEPKDASGSVRAIQTVAPTAKALGLTTNTQFFKNDTQKLAKAILADHDLNGQTVLICWEHNVIPQIAQALGLKNAPKNWDGDQVFDRMWVLTYDPNGSVSFQDVGEHVLPGDSP